MENLRIATPCSSSWERMAGDERVRHCTLCSLNVYNFAEMTRDEIRALIATTEGRVCARLYRRADGTVLTRDCPSGLQALRRRVSRFGSAVLAAVVGFSAFATGCATTSGKKDGSRVELDVERAATPRMASFTGVVQDVSGAVIPGVTVAVRDEVRGYEFFTVTDVNGAFSIASMVDGSYSVEATLAGFTPAVLGHVALKEGDIAQARISLHMDLTLTVTVGELFSVVPPGTNNAISTTLTDDFLKRVPIGN